ncbi:asparagine synthase-related protein [Maribacter thermophilus]|uniref:asparagine synthase-related protein n=1 Tax=Maribacter thermophilus TaxID=1197874 RepID=UPI000641465B|nr:asparagine synthase-related protein [Maribacter thermophilus]
MSKAIWICSREKLPVDTEKTINNICDSIAPDNIIPNPNMVNVDNKIAYGVMNPKKSILRQNNSLLLGVTTYNDVNWHQPKSEFPDGCYALFRDNEEYSEIVSDPSGSRTIWYYKDDSVLIASTSQIAIISYLNNFELNRDVLPWLLSTGSLGPALSWDKRIQQLAPNNSLLLKKDTWESEVVKNKILFKKENRKENDFEEKLKETISTSLDSLELNYNDWALPLSGGYDSRGILCFLKLKNKEVKTITWGLEKSLNDPQNDAYIAKKLAESFNAPHTFYSTNLSQEPIEDILERFIKNGEGRIDHIAGYLDGFHIWSVLHNEGVQGIIRGDEGFGWSEVSSKLTARLSVGLGLCSDYSNLSKWNKLGVFEQNLPDYLKKDENESIDQWRDRLYHEFRLPTIVSALSDLKLSYIEQISPLLSRSILEEVRRHPDSLRTEKSLFKKIVNSISPSIPYATRGANAWIYDILKQKDMVELFKDEIKKNIDTGIFPADFLNEILNNLKITNPDKTKNRSFNIKSFLKSILPTSIKNKIKDNVSAVNIVDYNQLALRVYISFRMINILKATQKQ